TVRSLSPYDTVAAKAYPHIFAYAGLTDPRVTYWEPAKWIARLRHLNTSQNLILLKTNMEAGHGGASGRFEALKEVALDYAFALKISVKAGALRRAPRGPAGARRPGAPAPQGAPWVRVPTRWLLTRRFHSHVDFPVIATRIEGWIVAVVLVGGPLGAWIVVAVVDVGVVLDVGIAATQMRAGVRAATQHIADAVGHQHAAGDTRSGCKG